MKIEAIVDGKRIVGNWNGKYYPSRKNSKENVRIYISGKEYDISRNKFSYKEILSEKQEKYAKDIKSKFLKKLNEVLEKHKIKKECKNKIKKYFEEKEDLYFLKNQIHLSSIISNIYLSPNLICNIITGKLDNFKVIKNKENISEEKLKELALNSLIHLIKNQFFASSEDIILRVFEKEDYYYIQLNNQSYFVRINKKTREIDSSDLKIGDKKYIAKVKIE